MRALVLATLLVAPSAFAADPLDVERAVALALERNVEVAGQATETQAARARLDGARLPLQANPELSISAGPRTRAGESSLDAHLEISQRFEIFGQRGARIDGAQAEVLARDAALSAKRPDVSARVRVAFARVLAAERLAAIAQDEVALSREALVAAAKRMEVGNASRLEVNAARVEVGRAARELALARQAVEAARGDLRLLTGMPAGDPVTVSGELPSAGSAPVSSEALVDQAVASRADLAALRGEVEVARAEARLASREPLPSPRVSVSYSREEKADIVLAGVSFDLPFWNRNQAGRGVTTARLTRAERELEAATQRARQEVQLAIARVETSRKAALVYDADLVAATRENLALTTQAYQAGKLGLAEMLLIRRSALDARRGEVEARAGLAEAEAELQRALGKSGGVR